MKKHPPDISCIGELIVDFIAQQPSRSLGEVNAFLKCPGGAASNVAVGLARLGMRPAFIGNAGDDSFGRFLKNALARAGVDTSGVRLDPLFKTRLAFVSVSKSGEREFEFWEKLPADERLLKRYVDMDRLHASRIVHVSSFLLLREPSRSAVLGIAKALAKKNSVLSFDPNLRRSLWKSSAEAKSIMLKMAGYATILRLNEEEATFLTGRKSYAVAARKLLSRGSDLVVITHGSKGSTAYTRKFEVPVDGFCVRASDTTGCGDGFLAGLLYSLLHLGQETRDLPEEALRTVCRFANAVGALTATRYGVFPALPGLSEVKRLLQRGKL